VLDVYCMESGQWINRDKSPIFFSKRCSNTIKEAIKTKLEVCNETKNEKYLGMLADVGTSRGGAFK
jgi:hypothetical protein